jgi:ATP-binding cassette subfamily B protein
MERAAFARALKFLSYAPMARWGAVVAGVGTGMLFVALLTILALFTDLVINRGAIPCFQDLPAREKQTFLNDQASPSLRDAISASKRLVQKEAKQLGLEEAPLLALVDLEATEPLGPHKGAYLQGLFWWLHLPEVIQDQVGEEAAESVRQELRKHFQKWGPDTAVHRNLEDFGLLSLVVRTRSSTQGALVAPLARWAGWTWRDGNQTYLHGLFFLGLLVAALRAGLQFLSGLLAARVVVSAVTRLRRAIYVHTYRLGTLAFSAQGPSEAVAISTQHLETVHEGMLTWLTVIFRAPVKFALLLLFAMLINFWVALAFLLFAVLVWIVGGQIAAHFRGRGRLAESRAADQLTLLQESLMMLRLVKACQMEDFNQARLERQLSGYADAQLERYRGEAIYRPTFLLLGLLAALSLLLVMGIVIVQGQLGVTSAVILVTALVSLYWPVTAVLEGRRRIRRARQSAKEIFDFLDRHGTVGQDVQAEFLPAMSKHLEFSKVFLREPGTGKPLLQGVNLTLQAGHMAALVGPEEQEKQALVYLLPRFLDPTSGVIRIDKKDVRGVTLDSLRAQIALVMQGNLVFNDTVVNNIGCGDPAISLARITEAAKTAHAHQFIQKLPKGYETVIGDMGHALNQGEMFRIALARAILRDPALLVIEEPVAPLDDDTKSLIDDTYTRVLSTIRRCHQVLLLHQGKIEAVGDHRALLASSDLYRHLQYLEFNEFANDTTQEA